MKKIRVENPGIIGNPLLMSQAWAFKAHMLIMEDNLKKYWPHTYRMMETLKKLQQG